MSVLSGKRKPRGITPTIVRLFPEVRRVLPSALPGSPKCWAAKLKLMIAALAPPGLSSLALNSRPMAGDILKTLKNSVETVARWAYSAVGLELVPGITDVSPWLYAAIDSNASL